LNHAGTVGRTCSRQWSAACLEFLPLPHFDAVTGRPAIRSGALSLPLGSTLDHQPDTNAATRSAWTTWRLRLNQHAIELSGDGVRLSAEPMRRDGRDLLAQLLLRP